eukprot:271247-Alexandrium_andersonii.AAC.1
MSESEQHSESMTLCSNSAAVFLSSRASGAAFCDCRTGSTAPPARSGKRSPHHPAPRTTSHASHIRPEGALGLEHLRQSSRPVVGLQQCSGLGHRKEGTSGRAFPPLVAMPGRFKIAGRCTD